MAEIPRELAAKVEAADLRNHVKLVGEGGTLSPANRQLFMAFAAKGDAEALRQARENALLTKWLTAGRLSKEEREEIAHILPGGEPAPVEAVIPAPAVPPPPVAAPPRPPRSADDYGHLGIGRRTYFRWRKYGETCADGPDLPPFDDPHGLPAWYERMRARGIFKHRFPAEIAEAITKLQPSLPAPGFPSTEAPPPTAGPGASTTRAGEPAPSGGPTVPSAFTADHGETLGLQHEVRAEQQRVASLRVARDDAYTNGRRAEGDMLDKQYREALDALSLVQQRALKIAEQESRVVAVELIEREFGSRLSVHIQGGMLLFDRIAAKLMATPDRAVQRRIWREAWIEHCNTLVSGRFAPPLQLEELAA